MLQEMAKKAVHELFKAADITFNGSNPWDIQVHDERFYLRVLKQGSLGLGESYMDGWWDCAQLDEAIFRMIRANLQNKAAGDYRYIYLGLRNQCLNLLGRLINYQSVARAFQIGKQHYDLGNQLFQLMLDSRMNYSCGYWKNCATLEQAQLAKLQLIAEKLQLKPGMRVLDIGCGWGAFAKYAAEKYQVSVVGLTVSKEQAALAQQVCQGLPVDIRLQDYRSVHEQFDAICSIGMFEHVGYKNYSAYMQTVNNCLKDDGLFLLHTIGANTSETIGDEWVNRYVFFNSMIPSISQIGRAIERRFVMEDWHNFGTYYDKTLQAWYKNFTEHWPDLKNDYDERFYRMWTYYLLMCSGVFRARNMQLWQIVLSKKGMIGGYQAPR